MTRAEDIDNSMGLKLYPKNELLQTVTTNVIYLMI